MKTDSLFFIIENKKKRLFFSLLNMNSISTELFFNEAEFQILIPNTTKENEQDPLSIVQAKPREFAFYGLYINMPYL